MTEGDPAGCCILGCKEGIAVIEVDLARGWCEWHYSMLQAWRGDSVVVVPEAAEEYD